MTPLSETQYLTFVKLFKFCLKLNQEQLASSDKNAFYEKVSEFVSIPYTSLKNNLYRKKGRSVSDRFTDAFKTAFLECIQANINSENFGQVEEYGKVLQNWLKELGDDFEFSLNESQPVNFDLYNSILGNYIFFIKWEPSDSLASVIDFSITLEQKKLILRITWNISETEKGMLEGEGIIDLESKVLCSTMFGRLKNSKRGIFTTSPTFLIVSLPSSEITKIDTLCGILTGSRDHGLGVVSRLVVLTKKELSETISEDAQVKKVSKFISTFLSQSWTKIPKREAGVPIFLYDHLDTAMKKTK